MQVVLFAAVLALAGASPALLGSHKCTFGPSYWCSHVRHAKECGTIDQCIGTVWKYNTAPVENDPKCEVCVFAVAEARKLLKDNATQEELSEFLLKGCSLFPEESMKKECEDLVKNYLPEIIKLITSDVDPKTVCTMLGMCTAQQTKPKQEVTVNTASDPDLCADCKKFMTDLEAILKDNKTEAQIKEVLYKMCTQLGPLEPECKQLVDQYIPMILNMLTKEFSPDVACAILGLCKSGNVKDALQFRVKFLKLVKQMPMTNDVQGPQECEICKEVMAELQKLDRDAKTQQKVEDLLKQNLCPLFGELKAQCEQLIDAYAPMIFEYLANELDPDVACKAFHLCSASLRPSRPLTAVSLIKHNTGVSVVKPQTLAKVVKPGKKVAASPQCVLCEFVLKELDAILMENSSRTEVTHALEAVCARLPDTIAEECKRFVDQYAPAVIELLVNDLDPAQVCKALGLCSTLTQATPLTRTNEGACGVCELVIQYVDSLLKENSTETEIEELLEKVCNFLPDAYKEQCVNLIEQYGPAILQLLVEMANPEKICSALGLCPNVSVAHREEKQEVALESQRAAGDQTLYFKSPVGMDVDCLTGPAVWCKDAETANKCGIHAVDYCRRHVWVS